MIPTAQLRNKPEMKEWQNASFARCPLILRSLTYLSFSLSIINMLNPYFRNKNMIINLKNKSHRLDHFSRL